ncbi:TatD family hydrolase [Castellaniella caeni]|uniref:TatD family hydrolase n=1 Tax=Castellaniella caeni TaxID=266123 RepID=UPI000C9F278E|nr:TatD family hydrolase [Castellaniella caeni]
MLIDTHCHLDATEFDADRLAVVARARRAGVAGLIIPAVSRGNFQTVRDLARSVPGVGYALGIHPLYVARSDEGDLDVLAECLAAWRDDPRLVAIGEIGLDYFVPEANTPALRDRQEHFYVRQLDLARQFGLPVLLHVRRSQDALLKQLRRRPGIGGIAHAFNGSFQQAAQFLDLGFALGMGGAMTFARALQIRRLAAQLPETALVLETDAPDIPPAWLGLDADGRRRPARNEPAEVARMAEVLAGLRATPFKTLVAQCAANACRVVPRLRAVLSPGSPWRGDAATAPEGPEGRPG